MKKYHIVEDVEINESILKAKIDGKEYSFELENISLRLKKANDEERNNFKISPSGYGISWPSIDEDLSIDGILGIKHKPKLKKNMQAS